MTEGMSALRRGGRQGPEWKWLAVLKQRVARPPPLRLQERRYHPDGGVYWGNYQLTTSPCALRGVESSGTGWGSQVHVYVMVVSMSSGGDRAGGESRANFPMEVLLGLDFGGIHGPAARRNRA